MRNTLQNMFNKGCGEHMIITTGLFVEGVIKRQCSFVTVTLQTGESKQNNSLSPTECDLCPLFESD